jgi:hypothetical protein
MTTVYVAIWEDRHTEPTAHVFSDKNKAIEWARKNAHEFDRHGEYEEHLSPQMQDARWLFNATYSCEGDAIRVVEMEIDQDLNR